MCPPMMRQGLQRKSDRASPDWFPCRIFQLRRQPRTTEGVFAENYPIAIIESESTNFESLIMH